MSSYADENLIHVYMIINTNHSHFFYMSIKFFFFLSFFIDTIMLYIKHVLCIHAYIDLIIFQQSVCDELPGVSHKQQDKNG